MKTDKKIECPCQEHHKHGCYFGKKPCLDCIGRNCTPQEQKSVGKNKGLMCVHCLPIKPLKGHLSLCPEDIIYAVNPKNWYRKEAK